ncbi:MAG TPA: DUF4349 domain-containing protein, partial [Gaiellaceae bacterium]
MTVGTLLRAHAPLAPDALRSRVLALEPRRTPSRRLVLVLAAALAVAVVAAVVDGLVSSGPKKQTALQHLTVRAAVPAQGKVDQLGGGGGANHAFVPSVAGAATRLQQYEASLDVRVSNVSSATTAATRVATSLGGYAQSVTYNSSAHNASLVLRVPVQNVKAAIARLEGLGTLVSQNLSVTDLQHDLEAETAQIAQLRRTIAALVAALRNPSLPDAQRVILQIRLANAKRSLSQRLHARTGTISAGTTARISLLIETKAAVVPVPHHRGRLGRMVHSAVGFLGLEGTIALYALIVLGPIAFVVA